MAKKNKSNIFYIYAVIDIPGKMVFIKESVNPDRTSILSEHRKGKIDCTDWEFEGKTYLEFIILDIVHCKPNEALKHILAWGHFFQNLKFEVLMPEYRLDMMEDLKDDTIELYTQKCEPYTLDEILTRSVPIPEIEISTPTIEEIGNKLTQLNVRVMPDVIDAFREFCTKCNATQSQGLSILLDLAGCSNTDAYANSINRLKQQNQVLKNKIETDCKELKCDKDKYRNKYNEFAKVLSDVVNHSTKGLNTNTVHPDHISPCKFKDGQLYHEFDSYEYPTEAGAIEITLQDIVRNKSNQRYPLFLLVTDQQGRRLKFRYYPRHNFAGLAPHHVGFAFTGSKWIYGYTLSGDGAVDLVTSIPIKNQNEFIFTNDSESTTFEEKLLREISREIEANRSEIEDNSFDQEYSDYEDFDIMKGQLDLHNLGLENVINALKNNTKI